MDAQIDPVSRDLTGQSTDTLANAVYLRLVVPLGSWWADQALGSRLHELARSKDVPRIQKLARQYAEEALLPLVNDGRAKSIEVTTQRPREGWLLLLVEVIDASGRMQVFKHPVMVI